MTEPRNAWDDLFSTHDLSSLLIVRFTKPGNQVERPESFE